MLEHEQIDTTAISPDVTQGMLPEQRKRVWCAFYRTVGTYRRACESSGVPQGTLNYWLATDKEFAATVKHLREHVLMGSVIDAALESALTDGARGHHDRKMLLSALDPEGRFRERVQVDVSVSVSAQLSIARGIADIRRERLKALAVLSSPVLEGEFQEVLEEGFVEV